MVGLTEEAAASKGIDYEVGRGWFANNARATIAGATDGLVKLVFERDDRKLLGVHVLGELAAELVHQGQAALHHGATIDYFIHTTFNVPTQSDAYKYAAYDGLQRLQARSYEATPGRSADRAHAASRRVPRDQHVTGQDTSVASSSTATQPECAGSVQDPRPTEDGQRSPGRCVRVAAASGWARTGHWPRAAASVAHRCLTPGCRAGPWPRSDRPW
jgi:Pyridine nucleotide-disulphide oxidoreductase, dimerisation domain